MCYEVVWGGFYAPNFKEVEGAYWFGSVRACVQCESYAYTRLRTVRPHLKLFLFVLSLPCLEKLGR